MDTDLEGLSVRKLTVQIVRATTRKLFLGGYRHRVTGAVYHHAAAQTVPLGSQLDRSSWMFNRSTQTCAERHFMQQTAETTSTQMTSMTYYIPNVTDKLLEPRRYVSADEFLNIRASQVRAIFSYHLLTGRRRRHPGILRKPTSVYYIKCLGDCCCASDTELTALPQAI